MATFTCADCGAEKEIQTNGGTGYAVLRDTDAKICYLCCGKRDEEEMKATGKSVLYLSRKLDDQQRNRWSVTNWPGTLTFDRLHVQKGSASAFGHALDRFDVWFNFDGSVWHGVNIGDNEILRCKRTKRPASPGL